MVVILNTWYPLRPLLSVAKLKSFMDFSVCFVKSGIKTFRQRVFPLWSMGKPAPLCVNFFQTRKPCLGVGTAKLDESVPWQKTCCLITMPSVMSMMWLVLAEIIASLVKGRAWGQPCQPSLRNASVLALIVLLWWGAQKWETKQLH